jgi:hypothetical protein
MLALCQGLTCLTLSAAEPDWITSVFPERGYDFGSVARGSQLRHAFPVVNQTNYEVRIADWRTKCGCTNVRVGSRVIPPGTQTTIEATIDTTKFQGNKASGLTLVIDQPAFAELDLNLTCFIRGDITLYPGQIDFGIVSRGGQLPSAGINLTYAGGRPDWEITKMKTQSALVKAEAKEIGKGIDGRIQWSLVATLQPGVPNGYFKDEITLLTNDPAGPIIPVSVIANVYSAVRVMPSIINFGPIRQGQTVSRLVHVRSATPFGISKLSSTRTDLEPREPSPGKQIDHILNLKLKAPENAGPYHAIVKVDTDLKDEPTAEIKAFATVLSSR